MLVYRYLYKGLLFVLLLAVELLALLLAISSNSHQYRRDAPAARIIRRGCQAVYLHTCTGTLNVSQIRSTGTGRRYILLINIRIVIFPIPDQSYIIYGTSLAIKHADK